MIKDLISTFIYLIIQIAIVRDEEYINIEIARLVFVYFHECCTGRTVDVVRGLRPFSTRVAKCQSRQFRVSP